MGARAEVVRICDRLFKMFCRANWVDRMVGQAKKGVDVVIEGWQWDMMLEYLTEVDRLLVLLEGSECDDLAVVVVEERARVWARYEGWQKRADGGLTVLDGANVLVLAKSVMLFAAVRNKVAKLIDVVRGLAREQLDVLELERKEGA